MANLVRKNNEILLLIIAGVLVSIGIFTRAPGITAITGLSIFVILFMDIVAGRREYVSRNKALLDALIPTISGFGVCSLAIWTFFNAGILK